MSNRYRPPITIRRTERHGKIHLAAFIPAQLIYTIEIDPADLSHRADGEPLLADWKRLIAGRLAAAIDADYAQTPWMRPSDEDLFLPMDQLADRMLAKLQRQEAR